MSSRTRELSTRSPRVATRAFARVAAAAAVASLSLTALAVSSASGSPQPHDSHALEPGNLLISRSVYENVSGIAVGTTLPPGCTTGCVSAVNDGTYPYVFNNAPVDGSFGITSPAFIDQLTPTGKLVSTIAIPNNLSFGDDSDGNQMVTSFSSKSELALNLSLSGQKVTFMGYEAPVGAVDVSNSNTPGAIDPTNPVSSAYYRVVAELGANGKLSYTLTNAYSGNNGRAAILNDVNGNNVVYTSGNAGNGSNPEPAGILLGAGAQILTPSNKPEKYQTPTTPTPVGSFNITQLGDAADKIGKDDNFRGLTVYNNVIYYTKGSGGNGVNTVYFLDTTGTACPNGTGLPVAGATLPTSPLAYNPATLVGSGLPSNMCILKGFPTALKSKTSFPFGLWFANPTTLYVADEGNGTTTYANGTYTAAAAQTTAGLQKWVFNAATQSWTLGYTLQNGLALGVPYTVAGYPTGLNSATGLPWAPATEGLRNITGRVNRDGTVTVYAVTSTVSGSGDQGADPNKVVSITDSPSATTPGTETFSTVDAANFGEVLRGVSFTPTNPSCDHGHGFVRSHNMESSHSGSCGTRP